MSDELPPAVARFVADAAPFVHGTDEAGDAARKFGREADKAGLQARKMGLAAKEAGERAAKAGILAAEAAEKAAKGFLREGEAANLAARHVRELERAEIAQAAAAIASAEASEKAAKAHRHQARDAEKAGGLIGRSIQAGSGLAESALEGLAKMGPLAIAGITAGIGLLPVAGVAAGTLLTLGLGGALTGLGLAAAKGSAKAKAAIEDLKKTAKSEAAQMGQPFEDVWVRIAAVSQRELRSFTPMIRKNLADLAPVVSTFADQAGASLHELQPAIDGTERAFAGVLRTLGPQMPAIMRTLSQAIRDITDEAEKNPEQITQMIQGLATLVEWGGKTVGALMRMSQAMRDNAEVTQWAFQIMSPATSILYELGIGSGQAAGQMQGMSGAAAGAALGLQRVESAGHGASGAARAQQQAQQALNSAMVSGKTTADQLKAALDRLTGANQTADQAEITFRNAIATATGALKEHGRGLALNTQRGRDNHQALIDVARAAQDHIVAMRNDGASMKAVDAAAAGSRRSFIALAEKLGASASKARELADRLLGIPKDVKAKISTPGIDTALNRLGQVRASLNAIDGPHYVNVHVNTTRGGGKPLAGGGPVYGPGTSTSDSVPAWLSTGEYVINAAATARYRPQLDAMNAQRYAGGGLVVEHPKIPAGTRGQVTVGGVAVSTAQWRSLGLQLGKDFLKAMTGSASEIGSMDRRLEKAIAKLIGGKKTTFDNKLIAYLDKNSKHLQALAKQRDAASKAIAAAKDYASGVTSNARSFAGLTSLDGPMNAEGIRVGLGAKAGQLKAFAKAITDLSKRGLSKGLLRQVIDAGPEQGLQLAQMLLSADRSTMSGINAAQASIDKVSTSLGRSSADLLYDAGKHAGQGFLTGLQASLKSLDKEMDKIAKRMVASLKKALHIKSPAKHPELLKTAGHTVDGFGGGVVNALPRLDKATALMAARIARPRVRPAMVAPLVAHRGIAQSATGGDGAPIVNVRVTLDGRELRAGVQVETLRYGRRNGGDNGYTRRR